VGDGGEFLWGNFSREISRKRTEEEVTGRWGRSEARVVGVRDEKGL
jgi:hypothetical protein